MTIMADRPDYQIYAELADWWPLISPPKEYTQESAYLADLLIKLTGSGVDVLDLGSGGGHVAAHLTSQFNVTLVDISDQMLTVSKQLNPGCEHIQGDMRTLRLDRSFDVVLVHDAIDYIIGAEDLRLVVSTAVTHCALGGIAVFVPDYVKDTFRELTGTGGGGIDQAGRTASFTERTWDPDPRDSWVQADYEFRLSAADGSTQIISESHRLSAFSRELWHRVLAEAGLEPVPDPEPPVSGAGHRPRNLFVSRRPRQFGA
jgi:SAM-dependent methyltransferase